MRRLIYVVLLIMLSVQCAYADEKRVIYDYEYGIFAHGSENFKEGDRGAASQGALEQTKIVKARLGTRFGVRYWLSRAGFVDEPTLHLIYHVPTMIEPSTGKYIDKIEILQKESKLDFRHTMAFEFAQQYELVPGEYRLYVYYENQRLLEQVFQVEIEK